MKDLFLLDPNIIYLNHGSFGATPRPVFDVYQEWQRRLERQPVLFLGREWLGLDRQARESLGAFLHAEPDNLVFVPNATYGVNLVARSLHLESGDEILTTNHEYGACENAWDWICQRTGARTVRTPLPLPAISPEEMAEQVWRRVTPQTKLLYMSHITSPTGVRLPVESLCRRAREAGLLSLIDGAHAPGQIPLNLEALGADFYTGNCHKWMMAPKGSAFLYARRELQPLIEPLVVSWGYSNAPEIFSGSRFVDLLSWTGTRDPAAALSVPAAIRFMEEQRWQVVRERCSLLLQSALARIAALTGLPPVYPLETKTLKVSETFRVLEGVLPVQMGVAELPRTIDIVAVKKSLFEDYRIEVPLTEWNRRKFVRISVQGYNTQKDLDTLIAAMENLLPTGIKSKGK